jgi:hypothetical protein
MGKIPRLPTPRITKARREIRKSVKKHKAGNALAQKILKAGGKPKNAADRSLLNKVAYRAAIQGFTTLKKAAVEALKKA